MLCIAPARGDGTPAGAATWAQRVLSCKLVRDFFGVASEQVSPAIDQNSSNLWVCTCCFSTQLHTTYCAAHKCPKLHTAKQINTQRTDDQLSNYGAVTLMKGYVSG